MASYPPEQWKAECEAYLTAAGPYQSRCRRYELVERNLRDMGFQAGDLVVDVGAGMCDFARYMYGAGYAFRYLPIDGSISGIDLDSDILVLCNAEWYVCIETVEHMSNPYALMQKMKNYATKGVVVTTPNPAVTDVLALDEDHKVPVTYDEFVMMKFLPEAVSIHYQDDTLLATYQP